MFHVKSTNESDRNAYIVLLGKHKDLEEDGMIIFEPGVKVCTGFIRLL
jgi:hypothetical protein